MAFQVPFVVLVILRLTGGHSLVLVVAAAAAVARSRVISPGGRRLAHPLPKASADDRSPLGGLTIRTR
jgi:hypothetical protein